LAIVLFGLINLRGAQWGSRVQISLTAIKVVGLLALVAGGLLIAAPHVAPAETTLPGNDNDLIGFLRFAGMGVAIVLFTYDGWIDASNIAGEVKNPTRNFPLAMALGVVCITIIYLLVNYAFLRVMPLAEMRANPTLVANTVAKAAFGESGGNALSLLMWISIFGALGGLIMTLPRLFYAAASEYVELAARTRMAPFFNALGTLTPRNGVPSGAIVFACAIAIVALFLFGSFSRIVTFFVVPFQFLNILMVSSIFRLRARLSNNDAWRMPFYPLAPALFIAVMSLFLIAAIFYNPIDSLIGVALTLAGIPVYRMLTKDATDAVR